MKRKQYIIENDRHDTSTNAFCCSFKNDRCAKRFFKKYYLDNDNYDWDNLQLFRVEKDRKICIASRL